jgi:hypothetical protein
MVLAVTAAEPLLQRGVPAGGAAVATVPGEPALAGNSAGSGASAGTRSALSATAQRTGGYCVSGGVS